MSKPKTLKLHIGLPKTGTTSFQNFIIKNENLLKNNGISGFSEKESFLCYKLINNIKKIGDNINDRDAIYIENCLEQITKNSENLKIKLISNEDLCYLPNNQVNLITELIAKNWLLDIIYVARYPDELILASWMQINKSNGTDWINFLESSITGKYGFLSKTLEPWIKKRLVNKLSLIKYEKKNLITKLMHAVDPNFSMKQLTGSSNIYLNESISLINSLYQNLLSNNVKKYCKSNSYNPLININKDLIERFLLDINNFANPTFEISQKFSKEIANNTYILGHSSYPILARYLKAWSDDALNFISLNRDLIDEDCINTVQDLAKYALSKSNNIALNSNKFHKLPEPNFAECLPLDSEFFGLIRAIAYGINFSKFYSENIDSSLFSNDSQ